MIHRRQVLQGMAATVGFAASPHLSMNIARAASASVGAPRRVIFFLQNQGFDPATCVTQGLDHDCSLTGVTLPEPISPLEPYKDKIHIINGLHGRHTSPSHSAFFGALLAHRPTGRQQKAIRRGDWKYIQDGNVEMLFDLSKDVSERMDRSFQNPSIFLDLKKRLAVWETEMAAEKTGFLVK